MLEILTEIPSTTLLGRLVRYPLKLIPAGVVVPIMSGPLRGKKWIMGAYIHRCWIGTYELPMQRLIAQEIAPGSVFYDIGANAGFYSLLASSKVGNGEVFSFEPLPSNVVLLKRHLQINCVHNVQVLDMAISNKEGVAHFDSEGTRGAGRLHSAGSLTVHTSSLDSLLERGEISPPNAIKMDIEGAEADALRGAQRCFEQYRPKLFLATHGQQVHRQCVALLQSWNYQFRLVGKSQEQDRAEIYAYPANRNR